MKTKLILLLCLVFFCFSTKAQTELKKFINTNGQVLAILQNGDTTYMGGKFSELGKAAKGIARFKPNTSTPDSDFPELEGNSSISFILSDDNGGEYMAGYFDTYNGKAIEPSNIIHVKANGDLDSSFKVTIADGRIWTLKKKNNTIYIGGDFSSIQNTLRPYLAAINATTGTLGDWTPGAPNGNVYDIQLSDSFVFIKGNFTAVDNIRTPYGIAALNAKTGKINNRLPLSNANSIGVNKNTLYLGGPFTNIGNYSRGFANISTSNLSTRNFDFPFADGVIYTILSDGKGGYFIGGSFTQIGNYSRGNIAHILPGGAVDTSFNITTDKPVKCLATNGTNLYFGGEFTRINGEVRNRIASVLISNSSLTDFDPNVSSGSGTTTVNSIICQNGVVYFGGLFIKVNNISRNNLAAVTIGDSLTSWNPIANGSVNEMIVNNTGSSFFVCGTFTKINAASHPYLAKLSSVTGSVDAWTPSPGSEVKTISLNKNILYIGGSFQRVNNIASKFLAAVDTSTALLTLTTVAIDKEVNDLFIHSNKLYVGGSFTKIQDSARKYIARIDLATGLVDNWNTSNTLNPDYDVYVINANDNSILLGGGFTLVNTINRNYIAAIDLKNNSFTINNWNPIVSNFHMGGIYNFLFKGSEIFASGSFSYTYPDDKYMANLISLNDSTGKIARRFLQYTNEAIEQMQIFNGNLMIRGLFQNFRDIDSDTNPKPRHFLSGYELKTNTLLPDLYEPNLAVTSFTTDNTGNLLVDGEFTLLNFVNRNNLAAFNSVTGMPTAFNPDIDNSVNALALKDSILFIGGDFVSVGGMYNSRQRVAGINVHTGYVTPLVADADREVFCVKLDDSVLYIGGAFNSINGITRNYGAAISVKASGTVLPWNPNTDNNIYAIAPVKDSVYIGGAFTKVNGIYRKYYSKCDKLTGILSKLSPTINGQVNTFFTDERNLYIGGGFSSVNNATRTGIAAFNLNTDTITKLKFNISQESVVTALAVSGNDMYIGTALPLLLSDGSESTVFKGNISSGIISGFNVTQVNPVSDISLSKTRLFVGGSMEWIGQYENARLLSSFELHSCDSVQLQINSSGPLSLCPGKSVQLWTNSGYNSYLWSNGTTNDTITTSLSGKYSVTTTDNNNCSYKSDTVIITTIGCAKPEGLVSDNITKSSVRVRWNAISCAVGYQYQIRKKGIAKWNSAQTTSLNKTITGLDASTTYQWRVKTACQTKPDTILSQFSNGSEFTTAVGFTSDKFEQYKTSTLSAVLNGVINPNPASDDATLILSNATGSVYIDIFDLNGKIIWSKKAISTSKVLIPSRNFSNGIYYIKVRDSLSAFTLKLIKTK